MQEHHATFYRKNLKTPAIADVLRAQNEAMPTEGACHFGAPPVFAKW